jgi:UDP-N-acetylglucosamine:LPS N-acetylglucosamine transferase
MSDLAKEIVSRNIDVDVLTTESSLKTAFSIKKEEGVNVIRVKTGQFDNVSNFRRTINELLIPFYMIKALIICDYDIKNYDGIISWSPSIFFGPLIYFIKKLNNAKSYLILRDIFPEWAYDLRILKKGFVYTFFKLTSFFQYKISDKIGVQSESNIQFVKNYNIPLKKIEVLNNWYSDKKNEECNINLSGTNLKNKKIIVYGGNIGAAQGIKKIVSLCEKINEKDNIGFLFIGRGSNFYKLKEEILKKNIKNTLILPEISPNQIPNLYKQCHIGLVILDERHKTHNIPGKFLSYLYSGLPVFALVNKNNDLIKMINENDLGFATDFQEPNYLKKNLLALIDSIDYDHLSNIKRKNCIEFASKNFHPSVSAEKVLSFFRNSKI